MTNVAVRLTALAAIGILLLVGTTRPSGTPEAFAVTMLQEQEECFEMWDWRKGWWPFTEKKHGPDGKYPGTGWTTVAENQYVPIDEGHSNFGLGYTAESHTMCGGGVPVE